MVITRKQNCIINEKIKKFPLKKDKLLKFIQNNL